jgi:hypothetical protein
MNKRPTGKQKLVAVSIHCHGKIKTVFTHGDVCEDGKVRVRPDAVKLVADRAGVRRGDCYSLS